MLPDLPKQPVGAVTLHWAGPTDGASHGVPSTLHITRTFQGCPTSTTRVTVEDAKYNEGWNEHLLSLCSGCLACMWSISVSSVSGKNILFLVEALGPRFSV